MIVAVVFTRTFGAANRDAIRAGLEGRFRDVMIGVNGFAVRLAARVLDQKQIAESYRLSQ